MASNASGQALRVSERYRISRIGQHARVTFDGAVGQRLSLGFSGMSSNFVRLIKPDGTPTGYGTSVASADSVTFDPLPVNGNYEIEVSSGSSAAGTSTLTLSASADAGAITVGGAAKAVAVTRAGQDGHVSFTGAVGDRLRLNFSGSTFPVKSFYLSIHKPDGTTLMDKVYRSNQDPYDLVTLPAAGTYVVSLDPSSAGTGSINVGLARVS